MPQQPPISRAPSARACAANSAKYAGVACGKTMRWPLMLASPTFGSAASTAPSPPICASARERGRGPGAVVRAERGEAERVAAAPPASSAFTPASVSPPASKVRSATIGSAETERTAAIAVSSSSRS